MPAPAVPQPQLANLMNHIAVIDYHMGNLRSVSKAIEHVASDASRVTVTSDPTIIGEADRVVFPGQGAARDCMAEIHRLGLAPCIREVIGSRPFLGICMGLQVLLDGSDESPDTPCLGIVPGRVRKLPGGEDARGARLTIPQMGWNKVCQQGAHLLWQGIDDGERFYFANSFYADPDDTDMVIARTPYGVDFVSAIANDTLCAVQFHPEKSQRAGLRLLKNFLSL